MHATTWYELLSKFNPPKLIKLHGREVPPHGAVRFATARTLRAVCVTWLSRAATCCNVLHNAAHRPHTSWYPRMTRQMMLFRLFNMLSTNSQSPRMLQCKSHAFLLFPSEILSLISYNVPLLQLLTVAGDRICCCPSQAVHRHLIFRHDCCIP